MKVAKVLVLARIVTAGAALSFAFPALAGEDILYTAAPEWVTPADIAKAKAAASSNLLVSDRQLRIEDGRLWAYTDLALQIANPQELSNYGTVVSSWMPDKGDLLVHELSILRDGRTIDVIADGARLDILRREESLEQRILDGQLTAALAVPGLRVGDTLRFRFSTTLSDQALGNEVQALEFLGRKPDFRPGLGRVRASWKPETPVRIAAGPAVELPATSRRDGYEWLEMELPLDKADDMPRDAPWRYHRPAMLQLGTFADWNEVSRIMAPYYDVAGKIEPGTPLASRADAIARDHKDKLAQAVAALALVQDEVGYLANGLDGGNYLPQPIEQTWQMRYGDCKAKTVLLLALLDRLGIEGEAVLVSSTGGDALVDLLPMPGAFDHVLVRATIDGNAYWLDGTSAGASLRMVGNVPPFRHALPLRRDGADLVPIVQTLPRMAEGNFSVDIDQTAGVDIPALFHSEIRMFGPMAAMLAAQSANVTEKDRIGLAAGALTPFLGAVQVYNVAIKTGSGPGEAIISADGYTATPVKFTGSKGEQKFNLPSNNVAFSPDRARQSWRNLPVSLGAPMAAEVHYRFKLPEGGRGFRLEGPMQLDDTIAGRRLKRDVSLADGVLSIVELMEVQGGEISPERIAEERRRAANLSRNALTLHAPAQAKRRWEFAGRADRSALAAVEKAYAATIAQDPDEIDGYLNRARFRYGTYDFAGAIADVDKAVELEKSAEMLDERAQLYTVVGNVAKARADRQEAWELRPTPRRAMALAEAMANDGDLAAARALLEEQDGDSEVRRDLEIGLAEIDALDGRATEGLARIDTLLADKPTDGELLNQKCWFIAIWNLAVDGAEDVCTKAVEFAANSAQVLDSRAMHYLRAGNYAKALTDAEAALSQEPGQSQTLLLRGIIRLSQGDKGGREDLQDAFARAPSSRMTYARYGFDFEKGPLAVGR